MTCLEVENFDDKYLEVEFLYDKYLEVEFLDDKYLEVAQEMAACFLPGKDSSTLAMVACKMSVVIGQYTMFSCSSMLLD